MSARKRCCSPAPDSCRGILPCGVVAGQHKQSLIACTTDLPAARRRPDVEVPLVHVDVLPFPSRVCVGSPHAPGFILYARTHREEQNQCSSHRFITMLIAFSSRLLLILAAERSRCNETGRGRSDETPTIRSGVLEYHERGQDVVWWRMWYEKKET